MVEKQYGYNLVECFYFVDKGREFERINGKNGVVNLN